MAIPVALFIRWDSPNMQTTMLVGVAAVDRELPERMACLRALTQAADVRWWTLRLLPAALNAPENYEDKPVRSRKRPNWYWTAAYRTAILDQLSSFWQNADVRAADLAPGNPWCESLSYRSKTLAPTDLLRLGLQRDDTCLAAVQSTAEIGPPVAALAPELRALVLTTTNDELRWRCLVALACLGSAAP